MVSEREAGVFKKFVLWPTVCIIDNITQDVQWMNWVELGQTLARSPYWVFWGNGGPYIQTFSTYELIRAAECPFQNNPIQFSHFHIFSDPRRAPWELSSTRPWSKKLLSEFLGQSIFSRSVLIPEILMTKEWLRCYEVFHSVDTPFAGCFILGPPKLQACHGDFFSKILAMLLSATRMQGDANPCAWWCLV